jgi:tetratricopeptide (TPR) repeat protein
LLISGIPLTNAPHQLESLRQQAELHASRKEWPLAVACFESILAYLPDDADVLLQLSYIHSLAGHYRIAREYALRASQAGPRDPDVVRELIARLRTFNEAEALLACIDRLRPLSQVPIPLLIACAGQLSNLNEQKPALEMLEEAKRGDPVYPPTLLARGQVLTYLGRFKEAESDLLQCQRRAPEIANTYWWLSRLRKQTASSNHIDQIRAQLARAGRKPDEVALLSYALHKELDDLADYPTAWSALEQACRAKRSRLDYRGQDTRDLVAKLMALPSPPPCVPASSAHDAGRVPIFIVGMHRSGTTLLEQMLDGHADVRGVGELYDFTSQMRHATDHHCRGVIDATIVERAGGIDYASIGGNYLKGMEWRLGPERFFTDKLPSNFLNIDFICRALPQAKILHLVRDPVETCFSNLRELFSDACPYSYDQNELADYHRQYQTLMRHWHDIHPRRILDVDYADLTENPESTLRGLASFIGIQFESSMLDLHQRSRGIATASAVQVRGPVVVRQDPKWLPYKEYLQPLLQSLNAPP